MSYLQEYLDNTDFIDKIKDEIRSRGSPVPLPTAQTVVQKVCSHSSLQILNETSARDFIIMMASDGHVFIDEIPESGSLLVTCP